MKRLLITGAKGQLGSELVRQALGRYDMLALDSKALDITDARAVSQVLGEFSPDAVINAAAYTAVDKAESEPEKAYAVNVDGPRHLAQACGAVGARLLQVSTDFVFDGKSSIPYPTTAQTNPLSIYGNTKRAGEIAVLKELRQSATVLRTSWVYGAQGNNFLRTMLRLMKARDEVGVVMDQVGAPTSVAGLAKMLLTLVEKEIGQGEILHWSDAGVASWYDFAWEIKELASEYWPKEDWATVNPIYSSQYKAPAIRPRYSVLDCRGSARHGLVQKHWRLALREIFIKIKDHELSPINE